MVIFNKKKSSYVHDVNYIPTIFYVCLLHTIVKKTYTRF